MRYQSATKRLHFSFTQWSTNGIDYIDTSDLTTSQDGYWITDVFSWWTTKKKEINSIRLATSYTNWDNYIKLYTRVNNASSWTLIATINNSTSTITRDEVYSAVDEFIDLQFKIEIHNDLQNDTPPILHELYLDYNIIEDR